MEKLLHWSIAASQGDKDAIEKAGKPDPKLLQQLFGGGPNPMDDPKLMVENMKLIMNEEADLENKLISIDNFEMLIENLDNANNIENLKLWDPLFKILEFNEQELVAGSLSIIGTAVQNNVNSQDNFLKYDGGLRKIINLANDKEQSFNVRVKALYALSNLVRNHEELCQLFAKENGLDIIAPILNDSTVKSKLKMRAIALVTAYISTVKINDELVELLRKDQVITSIISALQTENDINIIDRVLAFLAQLISNGVKFNENELKSLNEGFEKIKPIKDRLNEDDLLTVKYVLN